MPQRGPGNRRGSKLREPSSGTRVPLSPRSTRRSTRGLLPTSWPSSGRAALLGESVLAKDASRPGLHVTVRDTAGVLLGSVAERCTLPSLRPPPLHGRRRSPRTVSRRRDLLEEGEKPPLRRVARSPDRHRPKPYPAAPLEDPPEDSAPVRAVREKRGHSLKRDEIRRAENLRLLGIHSRVMAAS